MEINLRSISDFSAATPSTKSIQALLDRHSGEIKNSLQTDFDYIFGMDYKARNSRKVSYIIRGLTNKGQQVEVQIEKEGGQYSPHSSMKSVKLCC